MGMNKGQTNDGSFKKGIVPWNKGKKCDYIRNNNLKNNPSKRLEVREKMSLAKLGKGDGWIDNDGYKKICINKKALLEHRYIWEKFYGIKIPKGYQIHHIDKNKTNNNIKNLLLVPSSRHMELHCKVYFDKKYEDILEELKLIENRLILGECVK